MTDLLVIPARHGSKRLPAKPLLSIAGHSLLERSIALARCGTRDLPGATVVVATDHPAIMDHAAEFGCPAVMTPATLASGSDRALAAALAWGDDVGIVVNLQGDTPFLLPETIRATLAAARTGSADAVTPVVRLDWAAVDALREHKAISPTSGTTCIRAPDGRAIWFSKAILPHIRAESILRDQHGESPVWRHIGLYAYTLDALHRFHRLQPSSYELLEGLEQLRFLENGLTIDTIAVEPPLFSISGIDTWADVARAEMLIAQYGDPFERM